MLPSPTLAAPLTSAPAPTPSFLAEVAAELLATHDADALADLVVIVPTRRAVVYLNNELALATPLGQALWAPRIAAMEDYLVERAGVQVEEPIALQLRLFDIFKEIDPELRFDHFVGWGGLLLQDFSSLDQNLTDTKGVFAYLAEAKALERWQLDPELKTTGLDRYFGFWGQLHRVYLRFKKLLKKDHLAYPGLAYRRAVQHLRAELADPKRALPPLHYFVGLGGLSKAEETFIDRLHRVGRAELRFDADPFYLDADSPNRAGQALRRYWQKWDLPRDTYCRQEHLRERPHHVRLLGVANASMQGKLAGQLLAEARQLNPTAMVAVVLPDETLLLPVLHGLPPAELVPDFNVTMGLSFQSTALFNLVDLLFEVHLTGIREGAEGTDFGVPKYHHQAVTKLLAHPFLRRYQQWLDAQADAPQFHNLLDNICRQIVQRHLVLLPAPALLKLGLGHPLIEALFKPWNNCDDIIRACYVLIDLLKQVYAHEHGAIEAEYLYLFYTLVRQLDSAFDCREQRLSVRSFRRFLYEQMRGTRLPFAGEPLAQVQIMGLLETRALDFDHVIILSCNENALPPPKRQNSLFPYDVLAEFKLPTYADAEATAAYNFWRLLQRAGRVDLVHVLPGAEGVRTGERSRFLRQLEFDLAAQNPELTLEDRVVEVVTPSAFTSPPSPLSKREGELVSSFSLELEASPPSLLERGLGGEVNTEGEVDCAPAVANCCYTIAIEATAWFLVRSLNDSQKLRTRNRLPAPTQQHAAVIIAARRGLKILAAKGVEVVAEAVAPVGGVLYPPVHVQAEPAGQRAPPARPAAKHPVARRVVGVGIVERQRGLVAHRGAEVKAQRLAEIEARAERVRRGAGELVAAVLLPAGRFVAAEAEAVVGIAGPGAQARARNSYVAGIRNRLYLLPELIAGRHLGTALVGGAGIGKKLDALCVGARDDGVAQLQIIQRHVKIQPAAQQRAPAAHLVAGAALGLQVLADGAIGRPKLSLGRRRKAGAHAGVGRNIAG